jgi:hypothetical protein
MTFWVIFTPVITVIIGQSRTPTFFLFLKKVTKNYNLENFPVKKPQTKTIFVDIYN